MSHQYPLTKLRFTIYTDIYHFSASYLKVRIAESLNGVDIYFIDPVIEEKIFAEKEIERRNLDNEYARKI